MIGHRVLSRLKAEASRVGYVCAIERSLYKTANQFMCMRRLEVIHLTRDRVAPLAPSRGATIASRLATEQDLLEMRAEGTWNLDDELLDGFAAGDRCLLSFVDGERAGYTWVHFAGRPLLMPGLRIRVPADYLYNFAGFTLPKFRGHGLQPYRHHALLEHPEWRGYKGLLGYVHCTNWSSRRGQTKSGYQPLGAISLIGTHQRFAVWMSRELASLGIERIDA